MRYTRLAFVAVLLLGGCGGARVPSDGRATGYAPGVPDFDLDAVFSSREDEAIDIEALVSIPRASLVFVRDSLGFRAIVRTTIGLERADGMPMASPSRLDTLRVSTFAETASFVPLVLRQRLEAEPGPHVLSAAVEDIRTTRIAERQLALDVPSPRDAPSVGVPRLAGIPRGASGVRPLVALGVPSGVDSLRVRFDVFGATGPVRIRATLLRLRADTTLAEPLSGFTPSRSSLRARGVDRREFEIITESRQQIQAPDLTLTVETPLPSLAPGVYDVQMAAYATGAADPFAQTKRTFVVREPGFPRLLGVHALIPPLAYIATPREIEALRAAPVDSIRLAFDRFWGNLFQDRRRAAATLRAYYERVEEANRQFASHTEGWKTDRGMTYIMFGPPERVEDRFDSEVWVYGSGQSLGTLVFERTARRERDDTPFDVWTLSRDRAYDAAWRRALRLWRSGEPP